MAEKPSATRSVARKGNAKSIPVDEAKARVKQLIAEGHSVKDACAAVGRATATYLSWRKDDKAYAAGIDELRNARAKAEDLGVQPVPDFETFCRDWLKEPLFPHHLRILDAIEGRVPRDIHPSMHFNFGREGRVISNVPPGHGKTKQFSVNYPVWRIHRDPNVQIIIVSKSQKFAEKILGDIKRKLTSPMFRDMHLRFAPNGGWKDPDQSWTQTAIYVQGKSGGKDPTVQSLGISGQIYGARAELIILDDAVTMGNATQHEAQRDWVMQEVASRLPPGTGQLLVLGTRVGPIDLYSTLRDEEMFGNRGPVFSYFSQPAVLDYRGGEADDWETLWPYGEIDSVRMEMWTGENLALERTNERKWALVYQQQDVAENAVFPQEAVEASVNGNRFPGVMREGVPGVRPQGMQGLYVIGGLDPAGTGFTAIQIWALDKVTEKRYILDGFNKSHCSFVELREAVKRFTDMYGVNEWVIEKNAVQSWLPGDQDLRTFLFTRGCKLTPHYTNGEKLDPDFGVMSMAPLFLSCGDPQEGNRGGKWTRTPDRALIELPSARQNAWIQEFMSQLIVWQPSGMKTKQKTDLVMAAWFCEIACKRVLGFGRKKIAHLANPFASRGRLADRSVIDLAEAREELLAGGRAV